MAMGTRKVAPAIAAGCTSVIKPAAADAAVDAGAGRHPRRGRRAGRRAQRGDRPWTRAGSMEPLIRSGGLRKLSFTGSTEVGKMLLEQCADKVLRTSMELGGNAPFLVFDDADLDAAVEGAVAAKMRNMGEACTAANRFYVHEPVIDEFGADSPRRWERCRSAGAPRTACGSARSSTPPPGQGGRARRRRGGPGGQRPHRRSAARRAGLVLPATVLTGVPRGARMADEEIFGPVAPMTTFRTEEEALAAANDTEYGLVAYVYTHDLARALRVAERSRPGWSASTTASCPTRRRPFGGVKESGLGREGGRWASRSSSRPSTSGSRCPTDRAGGGGLRPDPAPVRTRCNRRPPGARRP